jgi:hypothetical protein
MPPSPPPNGYINFHSSEASITFICQNSTPTEEIQIVSHCDLNGKWIPNPTDFCSGIYIISIIIVMSPDPDPWIQLQLI